MLDLKLFLLQRLSALVMVPLVFGHIAVMIYAIQGGLSAEEILARTRGSMAWAMFYGCFVVAVSIHAAIGLRVIAHEWLGLSGAILTGLTWIVFLGLLWMGGTAVLAVTAAGRTP
jgi:fumarate reductase subunit C